MTRTRQDLPGRRAGRAAGRRRASCWCGPPTRSTAHTSSHTSRTATASSPATTFASSACPSAGSTRSSRSRESVKITFWYDGKYKVPADAKAAILSPTLVTAAGHPAHPRLHRRARDARRRGDPAGAHRGSGGVGRPSQAAGEAHRNAAADRAGRREHAGLGHQHRRRQPARPGRQHPGHRHQAVASVFGPRRPQHRHLLHGQEPVDPGVGAAGQHRPDAPAQPEPGVGDRAAGQRSRRGGQRRAAISTTWSATCRPSSPTTAKRWAPRRTSWPV